MPSMAACIRGGFGPNSQFHIQAPKEFDVKENVFEEISFELEAYISMMSISCKKTAGRIEESLEVKVLL